jgi:hypothetical protein
MIAATPGLGGLTLEQPMHFEESTEGDFRIYAGALEAPRGDGYVAAVVVSRVVSRAGDLAGHGATREAWRDESLACGHRWRCPDEALTYALGAARKVIRTRLAT